MKKVMSNAKVMQNVCESGEMVYNAHIVGRIGLCPVMLNAFDN